MEKIITQTKGINISNLNIRKKIRYLEPKGFKLESTSVWSFRQRGDWASHSGEYRGNFSPYIPRNIMLLYSKPGDLVLDMFCGAGTTAIEAKLLGRRCIASDINEKAIELAKENINFDINLLPFPDKEQKEYFEPELLVKDARDLSWLSDESVDLICTHPPYANIIQYTDNSEADLSFLNVDEFLTEMEKVARESFRVLKPGRQCALLIGDARKHKHVVPLGFKLINVYLDAGFYLRELIIKRQHNCRTTGFWYKKSIENNFLLLAHEYLPVFEKPVKSGRTIKEDRQTSLAIVEKTITPKPERMTLETTSVWVFPEKEKDRYLARNIVDRYAKANKYKCVDIIIENIKGKKLQIGKSRENYDLLWIKSSLLSKGYFPYKHDEYLLALKETIAQFKNLLRIEGYLAVETRDIRAQDHLIPMAKLIVDLINDQDLRLKEIVVVTSNDEEKAHDNNMVFENPGNLSLVHSYVIIYKKTG
ncbi:MAG: TRM11 family SAM-dependent methyltransferase [Candidatus Saccharicenans sp.]|uniref:TRM11 family SAM-dependent methyltransferase n=1 Tax=Candidatus Saccharicenans sp. TaxID=2819258 RepID=UPI00404A40DD